MESVMYKTREEVREIQGKKNTTYGLEIIENGSLTDYIPNAFASKQDADNFIQICREHNVSPVHVTDVMEDLSRL